MKSLSVTFEPILFKPEKVITYTSYLLVGMYVNEKKTTKYLCLILFIVKSRHCLFHSKFCKCLTYL